MKILLIALLIMIIVLFLKLIFRVGLFLLLNPFNIKRLLETLLKTTAANNIQTQDSAKMVKCAKCQLYIPEVKAYQYQGQFYCCEAHAKYQ